MSRKTVKLRDFLNRSKILVDIEDDTLYKRVTIRTKHQGLSIRDYEIGSNIGTKKQFILKAGQFVLSKIDAMYGAFGIAPNEVEGAIITGNFWAYDYDKSKVSIEWLNHFTNSPDFYELCRRASTGITHRKYLDEKFFLSYEVELPDLHEQEEIVKSIDSIRDKISSLDNELSFQLTQLENLNQAILQEAVQGKLVKAPSPSERAGAEAEEPARELLKRIKAEKAKSGKKEKPLPPIKPEEIPFEIPENWVWCRLGEVIQFISGNNFESTDFHKGDGVKCIKITNAGVNELVETDDVLPSQFRDQYKYFLVYTGDLVLALTRPYISTGLKISVCPPSYNESLLNQRVAVIRPIIIEKSFIFQFLSSRMVLKKYQSMFDGQGQQPNLKKEDVTNLLIPLPPLSEQKRIVAEIERQLTKTKQLKEHILANQKATEQLLKALLHQAFQPAEVAAQVGEVKEVEEL